VTGLVLHPDIDHPDGATREFQAQARHLAMLHAGEALQFDNEAPMPNRGAAVLNALAEMPPASLDWFATCCHGWPDGVQAGFDIRGGKHGMLVSQLVIALSRVWRPDRPLVLPLYSCSTASDPLNGFAASLSRGLVQAGVAHALYAHDRPGHTTRNPFVRAWDATGAGRWLVEPHSEHWRAWVARLHDGTPFHLQFPWYAPQELLEALAG